MLIDILSNHLHWIQKKKPVLITGFSVFYYLDFLIPLNFF
jgi:hypothetical protein